MKYCTRCGQQGTFSITNGHERHVCKECRNKDRREQRAGRSINSGAPISVAAKPVIPTKETEQLRKELEILKSIHPTAPATIEPSEDVQGSAVACAILSDWHVEERVDRDKVHGLNEYNLEIAKARAQQCFRSLLRLTNIYSNASQIDTLCLFIIGDLITNYIHEELRETNYLGPAPAANFALQLLVDGINFLLTNGGYNLIIDCIPGNHGRMTQKPRIANATETSLETFMYQSLAAHFKNEPRVQIRVANSKMLYRKFFDNFTVRIIHGDDISYGGGIGGVTIPVRKKIAAWDKAVRADLTIMGHFHQLINGGDFIVNGSLIGYNEYAQAIGASPEEPRQCFFLIHHRHGGQLATMSPLWVTD